MPPRDNRQKINFIIPAGVIAQLGSFSAEQIWRDRIRKRKMLGLITDIDSTILDVGCAYGDTAVELALRGNRVLGIDIDEERIEKARKLSESFNAKKAKFETGDFFVKDFGDQQFDGIIAGEIAEHFDNPILIIKKAHHLLKKGGWLIVSVPNFASLRNRMVLLIKGCFPDDQERHRHYFTRKDLLAMLKEAEFKTESIAFDFMPFSYGLLPKFAVRGLLLNLLSDLSFTIIIKATKQ